MHGLVRFSHIAAQCTFTTSEIYADSLAALDVSPNIARLLSDTIFQAPGQGTGGTSAALANRYRLQRNGYSICLVFLKLFERIYAPEGLCPHVSGDKKLEQQKHSQLDPLCQRLVDALAKLMDAVGEGCLRPTHKENKIPNTDC